jgi:hypothetical protein
MMAPVPVPITNELAKKLWQVFIDNETLLPIEKHRYKNEVDKLAKVDPAWATVIRAVLDGIANDAQSAISELNNAARIGMSEAMYANGIRLLINLGRMNEAYAFAKEGAKRHPMSQTLSNMLLGFSAACDSAETIESELLRVRNLFSEQPLLDMFLLDKHLASIAENDEPDIAALLQKLCDFEKNAETPDSSKRFDNLIDSLLDKVDP